MAIKIKTPDKIKRRAVPVDSFELFRCWLNIHAKVYGIVGESDIDNAIRMLDDALQRHIFEMRHDGDESRPIMEARKRFIAKWKETYRKSLGVEPHNIDRSEFVKLCGLVRRLDASKITAEEYIDWVFGSLITESPKFCPPSIGLVASGFCINKFMYDFREKIEQRRTQAARQQEEQDIMNRARSVFRVSKSPDIKDMLDQYRRGGITIRELRKKIGEMEQKHKVARYNDANAKQVY